MSDLGESRESFFSRVRSAVARQGEPVAPPALDAALLRTVPVDADAVALFEQRASGVGVTVRRTRAAGVVEEVVQVVGGLGGRRVAVGGTFDWHEGITAALAGAGCEVTDGRTAAGGELFDVEVGVTGVEAAVAESGTLVCEAGPGRSRSMTLVPAAHVAVVPASRVVADLVDWFVARFGSTATAGQLPSGVALITGPSKTADIEGILVTGVHGPGRVVVVLVEDA